jgi:WD40 repeat protein
VWDVITRTAFGPPLPGRLGRFNADGRRLLLSSSNGGVCLWDLSRVENPSLAVPPQPTVQPFARTSDGALTAEITGHEIVLKTPTGKFSLSTTTQTPLRRVAFSPDHRHLIAESPDRRAWIWNLRTRALTGPPWSIRYDASLESHRLPECAAEVRTQSDLLDLVALLAGQRPDGLGGMLPVEAADRERLLNVLQRAYPAEFGLTDTHRTRWHREHAEAAGETMDWEAAVFHWEHLLKSEIQDPKSGMPVASRLAYARAAAERIRQALRQGDSRWSVILPRPPQATSAMLDLEPFYTQPLGVTTAANPIRAPFRPLAAKVHDLFGTGFDVRGIVQLDPGKTLSIPVNRPCHRIHFLHAASQSAAGLRETAASYRVHFAEGDTASVRLSNPEDLPPYRPGDFLGLAQRDWQGTSPELHCTLVWSDSAIGQVQVEEPVILTRTTWEISDLPTGRWVTDLELQAGSADSVPLIFAITVE